MSGSALQKLRSGAVFGLINRVVFGIASILTGVVLARLLDPSGFGVFHLFIQIITVGALIQGFGMHNGVTKLASIAGQQDDGQGLHAVWRSASRLFALTALATLASVLLLWPVMESGMFDRSLGWAFAILMAIAIFSRSAEEVSTAYLRAAGRRPWYTLLLAAPREALFLVLTAVGLYAGFQGGIFDWVAVYVATAAAMALLATGLAFRLSGHARQTATGSTNTTETTWKSLALLSAPMLAHGAGAVLLKATDVWVLSIFADTATVGLYGAAVRVTNVVLFVLSVINLALPQLLAAAYASDRRDDFRMLARMAATISTVFSLPLFIIILFWAEPIVTLLFGAEYAGAAPILIILAAGQTVSACVGFPGMMLQMSGHQIQLSVVTGIAVIANLVANVIVAPEYGAIGVAWVTAITISLRMAVHIVLARHYTGALSLPDPRVLSPGNLKRLMKRT